MNDTDNLDADAVEHCLPTHTIGKQVLVFDSVSSTNTIAAEYARNIKYNGLVVLAQQQHAGRGRAANKWFSSAGDSILCSVVLINFKVRAELLSLAAAVAAAEAIGTGLRIKWPNDLMIGKKKAGGILLEGISHASHHAHILGIGINCHQRPESFPEDIRDISTSIDMESGTRVNRVDLIRRLLISIEKWLDIAKKDRDQVIEQWKQNSIQLGHRVCICCDSSIFTGNCIGVDPDQGLIIHLDTGAVRIFSAAHSSICRNLVTEN